MFSYIMAGTSFNKWDDDDVGFVLDQHVMLDFHSASSRKNEEIIHLFLNS
jgi:hypothetical protein